MTAPVIELTRAVVRRGGATGFSMTVPRFVVAPGEAVAVTGPSGSGKSTVLDALGLVLRPAEAETFRVAGTDAAALWLRRDADGLAAVRAARIGYILQTGGLLPFLSVRDNVGLSPALLGKPGGGDGMADLIRDLGLTPHLDKMPALLSIGERQRAAIARALAHRPAVLLADEPTASLDPVNAATVLDLLLGLVRRLGAALVLVSHDWDRVGRLGLRRYVTEATNDGGLLREAEP